MATVIELYLNGAWVAITSYARVDPGLDIKVGAGAESGTADANTCTLVVNNTDGRFNPRNTAGAYYPHLKRNTPVKITVDGVIRFVGECSEFPSRWEQSGGNVWVPLVASGILRRLQHASSLTSTLVTAMVSLYTGAPGEITGYWPVEDDPGATQVASALTGGTPGQVTGTPVFGAVDLGVGSHPVATWGGAQGSFTPAAATSTEFSAWFYMQLPASGLTGGEELFRVNVSGSAQSWRVIYDPAGGIFLQVIQNNPAGTELLASSSLTGLTGVSSTVAIEVTQNGANVDWAFSAFGAGTWTGTISTQTIGAPTQAWIGAGTIPIPADAAMAIGHVALGTTNTVFFSNTLVDGIAGYAGDTINERLTRLEALTGVTINLEDDPPGTLLGAQPDGTLLDVLRDLEKADAGGILYDELDAVALVYISRNARYNDLQPLLTLDYAAGHLSPPLEPTDDDQQVRNDVKVNRTNGSSARAELTSGALSTADYPGGVGQYPFEDTYSISADSALPYLADWVLALGTVDETRFPAVTVDLLANPSLVADAEALRPGSRLRIENLPVYAGATDVDLQVIGWREYLSKSQRTITFVCTPGSVWGTADAGGFFELDDAVFGELEVNRLAY